MARRQGHVSRQTTSKLTNSSNSFKFCDMIYYIFESIWVMVNMVVTHQKGMVVQWLSNIVEVDHCSHASSHWQCVSQGSVGSRWARRLQRWRSHLGPKETDLAAIDGKDVKEIFAGWLRTTNSDPNTNVAQFLWGRESERKTPTFLDKAQGCVGPLRKIGSSWYWYWPKSNTAMENFRPKTLWV